MNSSKTPIETAYQMLMAEGYAVSVPRSGLYIANYDSRPQAERFGLQFSVASSAFFMAIAAALAGLYGQQQRKQEIRHFLSEAEN